MSMTNISYPGFSLDLGDLAVDFKDESENSLWQQELDTPDDNIVDYTATPASPEVMMAIPQNTDSFKLLILIHDIPGVALPYKVKQLSQRQAVNVITKEVDKLIDLIVKNDTKLSDKQIQHMKDTIRPLMWNACQYHYADEYTDLI